MFAVSHNPNKELQFMNPKNKGWDANTIQGFQASTKP